MKNFLSLKRYSRKRRKAKTIIIKSGPFKGLEAYPIYESDVPFDQTNPLFIEKMEAAVRTLQECPIPEEVFRLARGEK